MIMDLELWGALPANNSWWWTVMMQQVVQAALHLGSPTGYNSFLMCYSVATYTPLFLEKSVLVAGINIHWLIDCICFDLSPLCVQKWVLKCDLPREYGIALVAFVWFFSAVCFQMPPQIACLIRCVINLVAFVSCPVIIKGILPWRISITASIRLTRQGKIVPIDHFFLQLIVELRWDF